jgi:hypothetical protein
MSLSDDDMPSFPHETECSDSVLVQLAEISFAAQKGHNTCKKLSSVIPPVASMNSECHVRAFMDDEMWEQHNFDCEVFRCGKV